MPSRNPGHDAVSQITIMFFITHLDGFDTDPLKKQYNISSSEHQYIINFCGASGSQKTCNGASDFGVCQILGDGTEVLAGKPTNRYYIA